MLEALLNHFRSYGMIDIEFIIVNSKLSHSQQKLHELQKRVSFQVYQETNEEEVWSVMEGGKDDMFIYDRCGRLTYFIPFPLSILNETPLVSNAILATYFRSPCGSSCDQNRTLDIDEFVRKLENGYGNATAEEENVTDNEGDQYVSSNGLFSNETNFNESDYNYQNQTSSNEIFSALGYDDDLNSSNNVSNWNATDYDIMYNNTIHSNDNNETSAQETSKFLNSLYSLFFNFGYNNMKKDNITDMPLFSDISRNSTSSKSSNDLVDQFEHHNNHTRDKQDQKMIEKKKSNRCVEADYDVCKSWSKKRLLHAQKCCSTRDVHRDIEQERSCRNFGKRRCKKIQSILKCCIKTEYTEDKVITKAPPEASTSDLAATNSDVAKSATLGVTSTTDIVCCKKVERGKLCRVSDSELCEEDEYKDDGQNAPK